MQPSLYTIPLESGVVAELPIFSGNKPDKLNSLGLSTGATACIYIFLVILFLVGAAGVGVSCYYLQPSWSTTDTYATWKWVGLGIGGFFVVVSILLILFLMCYQVLNNPTSPKKKLANPHNLNPFLISAQSQLRPSINGVYKISDGTNPVKNSIDKSMKSRHQRNVPFSKSNRIFSSSDYDPYVDDDFSDDDRESIKRPMSRPMTVIREIHHHHYGVAPPQTSSSQTSQNQQQSTSNNTDNPLVIRIVSSKGNERKIADTIKNAFQNQIIEVDETQNDFQELHQQPNYYAQPDYIQQLPQVIPGQGGKWVLVNNPPTPQRTVILSARPTRRPSTFNSNQM